jgi:alpha-tubulin suppressor-like RCC1 family protein
MKAVRRSPFRPRMQKVSAALLAMSAMSGELRAVEPPPSWWSIGTPRPVKSSGSQPLGVANIGQAKYMAKCALDALRPIDPTAAHAIELDLVGSGVITTWDALAPGSPGAQAQFSPLLIGQLKAIADPFYSRLNAVSPTWLASQRLANGTQDAASPSYIFPWSAVSADDANKAVATIGQLKAVFALRFDSDADGNQLPDLWELEFLGGVGNDADADPDGDGYTNLEEYRGGSDPDLAASVPPPGAIAAGTSHSLALNSHGRLWAWGNNFSGQVGNGSTSGSIQIPVPVKVVSGMGRIRKIAAGADFSAALDVNGKLWNWGFNSLGQLGDGSSTDRNIPKAVSLPPVKFIAWGYYHSLAVDVEGNLWGWGANDNGAMGNGSVSTTPTRSPAQISRPPGMGVVAQIAASEYSSYVLDENGKIWAWGYNADGRLGDGTTSVRTSPVAITLDASSAVLPAMAEIVTSRGHVLARAVNGSLWSWGYNGTGALGIGGTTATTRPTFVSAISPSTSPIAAGYYHSLAGGTSGSFWAWGNNGDGQLGNNSTSGTSSPVQITASGATNVVKLAGGNFHSLLLREDGGLWVFGKNSSGQLGLNGISSTPIPLKIPHFEMARDDSDLDGLADSWEYHHFGNLSHGALEQYASGAVTNWQKYQMDLNPNSADTDGDGMTDAWEILRHLDPLNPDDEIGDLDGDGLSNLAEFANGSDPYNPDSNGDGLLDGVSVQIGQNPVTSDTDGDSLTFAEEGFLGTNPNLSDTDGDGVPDNLDAYPLDPAHSSLPSGSPGDITPPIISLTSPDGATPF